MIRYQKLYSNIALLEVSVSIVAYMVIAWFFIPRFILQISRLLPFVYVSLAIVTLYILFISPKLHKETLSDRGIGTYRTFFIRTDNFFPSVYYYALLTLLALPVFIVTYWLKCFVNGYEIEANGFWIKLFFYLFSATAQDIFFFSFLMLRIDYILAHWLRGHRLKYTTLVLFAVLFALSHLPNPSLMLMSGIFAFVAGWIFYDTNKRNLLLIVLMHASLGTILHRVYRLNMKIGVFYPEGFHGKEHIARELIPYVKELIGNMW